MLRGKMYFVPVSLVLTCSVRVCVRGSRERVVRPLQIILGSFFTYIN